MPFRNLGLSDQLVRGVLATGYTAPTEIQSRAIPPALAGRDIIGRAQTGTGKTAAFVLPMLYRLAANESANGFRKAVRGLIVTPTRELALQNEQFVIDYGKFTRFKSLSVYGGASMDYQLRKLREGVDIVIATPGRLLDHMRRRTINLSRVEILVLDEADRMFDMGFINDVRQIVAALPRERQTLLFSATMPAAVKALAASILKTPEVIEVGEQRNPVETVSQRVIQVRKEQKLDLLLRTLKEKDMNCVLVFSRTRHGADRITRRLNQAGVKAIALHADRTQGQRMRALAGFKQGLYQVMVATDIAARGIDVEGISHVINFDVPNYAEDYIHRIGRTGRAEASGVAITFVSFDEAEYLRRIERFIGKGFDLEQHPDFPCDFLRPAAPKVAGLHISIHARQRVRHFGKRRR
jgi:ATP-dependent RNA helicase RhlE